MTSKLARFRYLDTRLMDSIDAEGFQRKAPFPWVNPQGFITDEGYRMLLANMPDVSGFRWFFGKKRKYGQDSHDRYVLDYRSGMNLPGPWQDFVDELRGDTYRRFICRLLGKPEVRFRFHWHYAPAGCSVSPHCDSKGKIGSHIFYFNGSDWDPAWGGQTIVLDDGGRISAESNPDFNDFAAEYPALTESNRSILFGRRGNSWHGVREIKCPKGYLRRVFVVVIEEHRSVKKKVKFIRRMLQGRPLTTHKESLLQ